MKIPAVSKIFEGSLKIYSGFYKMNMCYICKYQPISIDLILMVTAEMPKFQVSSG